jgi:hypothetical protein
MKGKFKKVKFRYVWNDGQSENVHILKVPPQRAIHEEKPTESSNAQKLNSSN